MSKLLNAMVVYIKKYAMLPERGTQYELGSGEWNYVRYCNEKKPLH